MKTYSVKQSEIKREHHSIDATDKILGHVAVEIANLLMGKHKVMFSRNADVGDCVTVINAEKVKVTGNKPKQKIYYHHSNYPGGLKQITYERLMETHPERIITFAVDGMLPHNHLHDKMMKRLKVYVGTTSDQETAEKLERKRMIGKKSLIRNLPAEARSGQARKPKR